MAWHDAGGFREAPRVVNREEAKQRVQEVCARNVMRNQNSYYARSILWKTASASNFFKRESRTDDTAANVMGSTLDSWGMGTLSKLRNALSPAAGSSAEAQNDTTMAGRVLTDAMLYDVFLELDVRGLGLIQTKQLEKALKRCGLDVSRGAMKSILIDMGKDPADGLTAHDFVHFFRKAEHLTMQEQHYRSGRPKCMTYFLVLSSIASTLVLFYFFMELIELKEHEEGEKRTGLILGLIVTGSIVGAIVFLFLCKPLWKLTAAPAVSKGAAAVVRRVVEADLSETKFASPDGGNRPTSLQGSSSAELALPPDTYRKVTFEADQAWLASAPVEALRLADDDWGEPKRSEPSHVVAVCHAPCRSKNTVGHVAVQPADHSFQYDPSAYRAAALMGQARTADLAEQQVPGSFCAMSPMRRCEPTPLPRSCPTGPTHGPTALRQQQQLHVAHLPAPVRALPAAPLAQYGSYRNR